MSTPTPNGLSSPVCYWAVIDAPGWRRPGQLPRHFLPLLEEQIPLPANQLHAIGAPCGDGRAAVCAVPRENLQQLAPGLASLSPSDVPEAVRDAVTVPPEAGQFNLLVGDFEPTHHRASRRRAALTGAAGILLFCGLLSVGLERRAAHWRAVGASAQEATRVLQAKLGLPADLSSDGVEVVSAYVDSLKALRRAIAENKPSPDGALALAELFRGWPATDSSETQSIAISGDVVTVSTVVRGDPRQFLDSLRVPAGWSLDEPRLNGAGDLTSLTIILRRAAQVSQ